MKADIVNDEEGAIRGNSEYYYKLIPCFEVNHHRTSQQEGNSLKDLRRMNDLNDLKYRLNDPDNYDIIIYTYIINIIY